MERSGKIRSEIIVKLSGVFKIDVKTLLYGDNKPINKDREVTEFASKAESEVDIPEIPFIVTSNIREKWQLLL